MGQDVAEAETKILASSGALASAASTVEAEESLLKARCIKDHVARLLFVGIFITENVLHAIHFEAEVDGMVGPAVAPLPRDFAVCLHLVHLIFGLFGATFVLVSGFDTAGRTALTKGTSMMLVFMGSITWTWWINRQGVPYWALDEYPFWDVRCSAEKRNRTVHILKNMSIIGALTIFQQMAKYELSASQSKPSFLEGVVTALRPWSFTATVAPQLVALAVLRSILCVQLPGYFAVFLLMLSIMAIQATANLVNSYRDFEVGIDTKETAGDRTLVDGLVTVTTLKILTAISFVCWMTYLVWSLAATNFDPLVLSMAAVGTVLAIGYTAGPAPLKYLGLGDLVVFICFGPGVITYSCVVLVGALHWETLAFTLPVTLYVVAALHANNHRDIKSDSKSGARTVAIILGQRASILYYGILLIGAHIAAVVAGWSYGCLGALCSLAALPNSVWLCVRITRESTLRTQDEETAKGGMVFGVALALGILIMPGNDFSPIGFAVTTLVALVLKIFSN
eukprot:TRINITY_DN22228_c0_g2_i2.p1 TRINITY_DN22228_c0_g2~~TRINITY_DN22228_c0_g2_i2.p1  ORF type:complete len:540 (+),score=93.60 TRINITY_DN22228_c0_g2_i2:92-1621(+)